MKEKMLNSKIEIDDKDRKIIAQLQLNARQTITEIAKKTKLPRDVVKYRIKILEQSGVIRNYHALINTSLLGFNLYAYVGFSLLNIEPEEEKEFVSYLTSQKNITYVSKTASKYDFIIGICARDYIEFNEILTNIRKRFGKIIKEFDSAPIIKDYKYDWVSDLI